MRRFTSFITKGPQNTGVEGSRAGTTCVCVHADVCVCLCVSARRCVLMCACVCCVCVACTPVPECVCVLSQAHDVVLLISQKLLKAVSYTSELEH